MKNLKAKGSGLQPGTPVSSHLIQGWPVVTIQEKKYRVVSVIGSSTNSHTAISATVEYNVLGADDVL